LHREKRLLHYNYEFYQENVSYKPEGMTIEQLQRGQLWAYKEFFSLANITRRLLSHWRSPVTLIALIYSTVKFRKKMREGFLYQEDFLKFYNRDVLNLPETSTR
jgi:hypothetical protein